jgi:hypothetical protein
MTVDAVRQNKQVRDTHNHTHTHHKKQIAIARLMTGVRSKEGQ